MPLPDLNDDVLYTICSFLVQNSPNGTSEGGPPASLESLSRTNRRLRDVSLPWLFRNIAIRGDGNHAVRAVRQMEICPAIARYARSFKLGIQVNPQPSSLAPRLANVLKSMVHLEKLVVVVPEHHADTYATEFAKANVTLPHVKTLVVGPLCEWAVELCPNVATISTNGYPWLYAQPKMGLAREHSHRLIKAAAKAPKVQHFEMMERWRSEELQAILDNMPNISSLALVGSQYQDGISPLLPILSRFTNLTRLVLEDAAYLDVGYDPPECGNVYMEPGGDEVFRQVQQAGVEAEKRVARMVFPLCPKLQELWVGDRARSEAVRGQGGDVVDILWRYETRDKLCNDPWL